MRRLIVPVSLLAAAVVALAAFAPDLNRTTAEGWFNDYLTQRFGDFTHAYIHCANFYTDPDDGSQYGDCWAHFKSGARWHTLVAGPELSEGDDTVTLVGSPFHRSWVRRWRRA